MKNYTLNEYALLLENERLLNTFYTGETDGTEEIQYLTFDSKKVVEGTLFVCKGAAFKSEYLEEAIRRGATCYVSEKAYEISADVPYLLVDDIRKAMPILAEKFNNEAWQKLNIIGIGGTKGKSTTACYTKAILDDYCYAKGKKETALISTIDTYDGVIRKESSLTTPEAVELQEHFRHAVESEIEYLQMEVSSQALKYGRVDHMMFDVGIFLNISEDHISPIEHPDFEDYFRSKLLMFKQCKYAVVNKDADFAERVLQSAEKCSKVLTFSTTDETADLYAYQIEKDGNETVFRVKCDQFDEEFRLGMSGIFNVENALAAIGSAILLEIPVEYMKSGLVRARTSGRMELYASSDKKRIAIVDFAHNKLSFEKLITSTREEYPDYKVVMIFGCPGNKANIRRQHLGEIAGEMADYVYLTADDPAYEKVEDICNEIASFMEGGCPYTIVLDRSEAIHQAMKEAEGKTVFLVTGKGDEAWLKYENKKVPCKSDVENVKECLAEYEEKCGKCV